MVFKTRIFDSNGFSSQDATAVITLETIGAGPVAENVERVAEVQVAEM
jgi:hypothetical protein